MTNLYDQDKASFKLDDLDIFIRAEAYVNEILDKDEHLILANNYYVHNLGEIDIISKKGQYLYATLVLVKNKTNTDYTELENSYNQNKLSVYRALKHFTSYRKLNAEKRKLQIALVTYDNDYKFIDYNISSWDLLRN